MKILLSKKKIYLLIILSILFVGILGAGVYLFLNNQNKSTKPQYNVDKYSDVVNWCNSSVSDSNLSIDCKALLLNIDTKEDGTSCFDVQVISNSNELKDLTVCEKGGSLTYTNEVLGYKKLMPIDIIFSYSQDSNVLKKSYSFTNVSFKEMDESYIQSIVNEDIANLVTLDPSSTTIKNSVDFCPNPSKLPDYVTEANKTAYTAFYNNNIMDEKDYTQVDPYSDLSSIPISLLFQCESASNLSYDICNKLENISPKYDLSKVSRLSTSSSEIKWNNSMDYFDILYLKNISFIYDSIYLKNNISAVSLDSLDILIKEINAKSNINERTICSLDKIYSLLEPQYNQFSQDRKLIKNIVFNNINSITSFSCSNLLTSSDNPGIYFKIYYSNNTRSDTFLLYDRCNNLYNIITK